MARRYVRDNRGRFATTGATARGGRLRTAAGNKRETQTRRISGGGTGGTVAKPRGLAPDRNASVKLATNQRLRTRAASRQAAPVAATTPAPAKGSLAANKIEMAKGRSAVLTQQKDSLNKQLKEVNSKIKEAGPSAGAYRLQKLQIQSRLSETRSALAASKAVAAPAQTTRTTSRTRSKAVTLEKVSRITQRVNAVTANAASKQGVQRLNSTEVGVRAKAFLTRKVGGMSGLTGKTYEQQQAAVRSALTKPTRYSTQKANRNKPGAYNQLGQTEQRRKLRAADNILRNSAATSGRAGNAAASDTARQIAANAQKSMATRLAGVQPQPRLATQPSGPKAPDTARTRANRLRTTQNRVRYFRAEPDSLKFQRAVTARNAALQQRQAGVGGKVVFRGKNKATSRQNIRANDLTTRIRYDLQNASRGQFSATGGGGRTGIRRTDTGNRQLNLLGSEPAKLYRTQRTSISRASGKSRKFYR